MIPNEYHGWYESLPTHNTTLQNEVTPEPGYSDSDMENSQVC